jgi:hypothetical protein
MKSERTAKQSAARPAAFPRRVSVYETDEGFQLLKELAHRRGVSSTDLIRMLIREEAERAGLEMPGGSRLGGRRSRVPDTCPTGTPIWERLAASMRDLPQEALDTLPEDLAAQHDHYLYGAPKR